MWARRPTMHAFSLLTKDVIILAALLFLIGVFFAIAIPFVKFLQAQASSRSIQIETATVGDDVRAYLPLRAKELGRGVQLGALYEIRVPPLAENFAIGDKFKLPDDLKIEI